MQSKPGTPVHKLLVTLALPEEGHLGRLRTDFEWERIVLQQPNICVDAVQKRSRDRAAQNQGCQKSPCVARRCYRCLCRCTLLLQYISPFLRKAMPHLLLLMICCGRSAGALHVTLAAVHAAWHLRQASIQPSAMLRARLQLGACAIAAAG